MELNNMIKKCGTVALIGAPNAGKSTLTNLLVGAKVSIVTHKVQTTRTRIMGIVMVDNTQIVLVDTPGIFKAKKRLDRAMVSAAWSGTDGADIVCLLVDATHPDKKDTQIIIEALRREGKKCVLLLNKVDLVRREKLLETSSKLWEEGIFSDVFMISALKDNGIEAFKEFLVSKAPEQEYIFDSDNLSDMPNRMLAAEVTREKLFLNVHEELPYSLTVETEGWEDFKNGDIKISQIIYVEKESQRAIILGDKGERIKRIGRDARIDLGDIFDTKVHLFLHIKVKENWQNDAERYIGMGLEFSN